MQHRNSNQSHQGRHFPSGERGANQRGRSNNNWRSQERDDDGRFMEQGGGPRQSRGSNDNWKYEDRDERGRFTDQSYRGSGQGDYEEEDNAYGRVRNQTGDYGYNRDLDDGRYQTENSDQEAGSFGSGSQGRYGRRNQENQFDDDYTHWRNEQIGKLDEDYKAWQGERRQKFSDEFGEWRSERSAKGDKK